MPHADNISPWNSSTRSRHSLRGNNRLVKNSVPKLRLEGRWRNEVDAVAQELAKFPLEADEFKEANRSAEFDKQIDVAVRSTFILGERTEQG